MEPPSPSFAVVLLYCRPTRGFSATEEISAVVCCCGAPFGPFFASVLDTPESPGYAGVMQSTSSPSRPSDRPRKEEVTVSLDRPTLDAVDADAARLGLSRSAVLRMAIVKVYPR